VVVAEQIYGFSSLGRIKNLRQLAAMVGNNKGRQANVYDHARADGPPEAGEQSTYHCCFGEASKARKVFASWMINYYSCY
jgi:hypothetical protein